MPDTAGEYGINGTFAKLSMPAIVEIEKLYMNRLDWEVKENANTNVSYSNFLGFILDKTIKQSGVLLHYLPSIAVKLHFEGGLHIHKLPHSLWIPYCAGWSLLKLLYEGLKTPTIWSRPAKHLDTAVSHLVNFFFLMAQEWSGAQAVTAFDLHMAPFIRIDKLNDHAISQAMQRLLYELNYPTRTGYQSPFSNITLVMDSTKVHLDLPALVGGEIVGKLSDFLEEALRIDEILFKLYMRGDTRGQPFTFPIPTIMMTPRFDWKGTRWGDLVDLIFDAIAKRGVAYILNGYSIDVEALYAMCCRLTIDTSKLPRGVWAAPEATGSIGYLSLNLPRLAYLSRGEWSKFEELVREYCEVAKEVLKVWRARYERSIKAGLMPMTRLYLGHLKNHYSTLAVIGLPEAVANFIGDPKLWFEGSTKDMEEAVVLMRKMISLIRSIAEEFEEEEGVPFNVEEAPAESAAYRLAVMDYKLFREAIEEGEWAMPLFNGVPFYSNSIIPYYADIPVYLRAKWEGIVQREFTGGVMMHLFLGEQPEPEALRRFVYRLCTSTKIVYFSITPVIAICTNCSWHGIGLRDHCPKCGSRKVDLWSRIVGYYRPVRNWNVGKLAEFKMRVHYSGKVISPESIITF